MADDPSAEAKSMEARVTKLGEAIGERVQAATATSAAVAGHAQELVRDAGAAAATAADQANRVLAEAGEAAQQAWAKAEGAAADVVDAGRRAHGSVSRKIQENPLMAILIGCALGYVAGRWLHGRER